MNTSQSTDDPVITQLSEVSSNVEDQIVTQNHSSGDGTKKDCSKPHTAKSTSTKFDKRSSSTSSRASTTATRAPTDELQKMLEKRREREKNKDALKEFESKVFGSKK